MTHEEKNTAVFVAYDDLEPFDAATPEKNLLKAILLSAMSDLRKGGSPSRKAQEFFMNRHEDYIFSFQSICNFLDLDPNRILMFTGLKVRNKRESSSQPDEATRDSTS